MSTQISFTTTKDLKKQAMKKAKEKGLTLKALLVFSMQAFVDGKIDLGIVSAENNDVEEIKFKSKSINENAEKLANLLS